MQIQWFDFLAIKENQFFKQAGNDGEMYIEDIWYVDGYNEEHKCIAEFNGDFWHGNPLIYDKDYVNKINIFFGGNCTKRRFKEKS